MTAEQREVEGSLYSYEDNILPRVEPIADRVYALRSAGALTSDVLYRLRQYFKIKNIYNSNAIEGNLLDIGETRQVVEVGLTISGKSLKDQAEAKNLAAAVDFLEELVRDVSRPIMESDIRQIHGLILKGIDDDNAGRYRTEPVEISGSSYKPPGPEKVPGDMASLGSWLSVKSCPGDRFSTVDGMLNAAAAHAWLVYVHPFKDGNGRTARLLMNLFLMRYGFPIAVVLREDRLRYYEALEISQSSDLTPFIDLISECVVESLDEYEAAAREHRETVEWARSLAQRFSEQELRRVSNHYEIWKNAMELSKSYMRDAAMLIDGSASLARVYFKDFGTLDFEKYLSLRQAESAKKTWFFRMDFCRGERSVRYLFFFGYRSHILRDRCHVTLHIAREEPQGSYHFERLANLNQTNAPNLAEVGYDSKAERFVARLKSDQTKTGKIEELGRTFFEDVMRLHFSS
ncbi:MAG: Fic family protein [Deltaproteobacteria bacterium]|nr:Fic family protein [Deltaproteobacteria bacterium]